MEKCPPNQGRPPTTNITSSRLEDDKIIQTKSHRENNKNKVPKQIISGPKERRPRRETNYRPLQIKHEYKTGEVQDANNESSPAATAQGMLDSSSGLERRVLARASYTKEKTLPGFQIQRTKLAIQSPSIRSKFGTKDLYKINSSCHQNVSSRRHLVPSVFGRFTNNQQFKRRVPTTLSNGHLNNRILRLDHKSKQISRATRADVPMARSSIRPTQTHSTGHTRENGRIKKPNIPVSSIKKMHKKRNNEIARLSQLDRPIQPLHSTSNFKNKNIAKIFQKKALGRPYKAHKRHEIEHSQMVFRYGDTPSIRHSFPIGINPNRRIIKRLRIPYKPKGFPRSIRPIYGLFDKHVRTSDHLVRSPNDNRKECFHSDTLRQYHSNISNQKRHIGDFSPDNAVRSNMEKSLCSKLDSVDLAHTRQVQCTGGSTFKGNNHLNRMVSSTQSIQTCHSPEISAITGGPVRHQPESPVGDFCFPVPGSRSSSSGRDVHNLGQVGTPICLSPVSLDFEGFSETDGNPIQEYNLDNTRPGETLVLQSTNQESPLGGFESSPTTNGERQTSNSTHNYHSSRVDVIKSAYSKEFPNCQRAVDLMATPLRKSSVGDYQQKWKYFIAFLKRNNIPFSEVTTASVLQFLTYLFYEKHLKPGTIAHYRTALTVPMEMHFQINLKSQAIANLIRSMYIQRPNKPVTAPTWSLNKVLEFLDKQHKRLDKVSLLRKTAFLLLLATGWRISELHACVRNTDFCSFSKSSLLLRPHPSFLAKNESTQKRWVHKEIKVLKLQDGTTSNLCPVTNLKRYLNSTKKFKDGDLLLTPKNKKFTVHGLSTQICALILQADPNTRAKVHDIRKYAASYALAETMLMGDLISTMNWSSSAIFVKFYLTQTEPLARPVSLPVQ